MPSQDKLIKQGIKYTDSLFDEITKRLEKGVISSDTLEAFLAKTKDLTTNNPLVTTGYDKKMLELILQETNNHRFSRPAQKEMVRVTIENVVGEKIRDVGDNIINDVRDIVKDGYNNNLSQDQIANNISQKVTTIKNKRARAIARTEVARAATTSDYIINAERGATHFYVECRNTACAKCKEAWHTKWTPETDDTYTPKEYTAGKKGWVGDKTYPMSDTAKLPPIHPNCRCVPYFVKMAGGKPVKLNEESTTKTTPTTTAGEHTQHKLDSNNELMGDGRYVKYDEVSEHGREFEVYKFDNIEIAVEKGTDISIERFARHLDNLPKEMVELSNAKRIEFCIGDVLDSEYGGPANAAGLYYSDKQQLSLYMIDKGEGIKDWILSNFDHEFSHSIDLTREGKIVYSDPKVYDKIVVADNKFHGDELIDVFPTEYAGAGYLNYPTDGRFPERRYLEDFAESSKIYLRPTTHKEFCEKFPNRAKYLEGIYGKPKLKDVEYSDVKKIVKPVQHSLRINDIIKEYDARLNDIDEQLAKVEIERDDAKQKARACETEECKDKWSAKRRALRTERKRLEKVRTEIDDERFVFFKRKYQ